MAVDNIKPLTELTVTQLKRRLKVLSENEDKLVTIFSEISENNAKVQKEINYKSLEKEQKERELLDKPFEIVK